MTLFLSNLVKDLTLKFHKVLLPEIVSRSGDSADVARTTICICKRPPYGSLVTCHNSQCSAGGLFHFPCVQLSRKPRGNWLCNTCKAVQLLDNRV